MTYHTENNQFDSAMELFISKITSIFIAVYKEIEVKLVNFVM